MFENIKPHYTGFIMLNQLFLLLFQSIFLTPFKSDNHEASPRIECDEDIEEKLGEIEFDIFFNPTHTVMGQSNKLKKKLEYMSKWENCAIHTANVPSFQKDTKSSMYCFCDGKEIGYSGRENWIGQNENWSIETFDIKS